MSFDSHMGKVKHQSSKKMASSLKKARQSYSPNKIKIQKMSPYQRAVSPGLSADEDQPGMEID
jgi:hypothetical protein